jgi:hypothetical protein
MACKGQGLKSPQLHLRSQGLSTVDARDSRPSRSRCAATASALIQGGGHAATMAGVVSRQTRPIGLPPADGRGAAHVAHQLVDDPRGEAASPSQVAKACRRSCGPQVQVGQLRPGRRVHGGPGEPPWVVGRQRRPGAAADAVAAAGPGEDQVLGTGRPRRWRVITSRRGRAWAPPGRWPGSWVRP